MTGRGFVIWLTGLSGAGKTTIAAALARRLADLGRQAEVLDGDIFRKGLGQEIGFSARDRIINNNCMGYTAKILSGYGITVIVAAVSPYREARDRWKKEINKIIEVYAHCPLEVCIERDVKGLYARALAGEIGCFTGISDPYEEPLAPDLTVHTHLETPDQSVEKIINVIRMLKWV